MTKYFTISCNGFQSEKYFREEKDAIAAADRRSALSGQRWSVSEIWLTDPYADDERPYRTVR